jgi:DNA-binding NarL/FixJ family response regulator
MDNTEAKTPEDRFQRSVVIVEDDPFMRSLLAEYLEKAGFLVSTASSAADARRQINAVDPDAVVLDIDLGPGPSGLDIAATLNTEANEVGIVFLTNYSDPRFAGEDLSRVHPKAAYLNKHMIEDSSVLVAALNAVLVEVDVEAYRYDKRSDRPMARLSASQIQALRLLAEGKTNQQIAEARQRSIEATESLITRTLAALGLDSTAEINARVSAAREFITHIAPPRSSH